MSYPYLAGQCCFRIETYMIPNTVVKWLLINTEVYFYAGRHVQGKAVMHSCWLFK